MPDLLHQGGLTMAIFKKKTAEAIKQEKKLLPSNPHPDPYLPVPDFTYSSDCLAQVIVDAWDDKKYRDALLAREADGITVTPGAAKLATDSVNSCGFNLERAVVISEKEYYDGYTIPATHPDEIVFVLPDLDRVRLHPTSHSLLETAKLLMATTPNGI
jgi:hypothetical protein